MKEHQQQYAPWAEVDERDDKIPLMTDEQIAAAAKKAAQAMAARKKTQKPAE